MGPCIAFLLAATLCAQSTDAPSPQVYKVGKGVSAPVTLHRPTPNYTKAARQARFEGSVIVRLVVDQKGRPQDLKIVRPIGLGLDEQAIKCVQKWRFKPALKDGQPVPVSAQVEVSFRLIP